MFGTIGRARLKAGARQHLDTMMDEWTQTVRPKIPGEFINLVGNDAGDPDAIVFVALARDERTYRDLANLPEQDAWYRRFAEHVDGEVSWQDVEMTPVRS
jgi:hypothetical protein